MPINLKKRTVVRTPNRCIDTAAERLTAIPSWPAAQTGIVEPVVAAISTDSEGAVETFRRNRQCRVDQQDLGEDHLVRRWHSDRLRPWSLTGTRML